MKKEIDSFLIFLLIMHGSMDIADSSFLIHNKTAPHFTKTFPGATDWSILEGLHYLHLELPVDSYRCDFP